MQTALAASALLMGLAGGPHCVAMCGAACAGVVRGVGVRPGHGVIAITPAALPMAPLLLQAGRMAGYAAAGALAAATVQSLTWASVNVSALRGLWMLFHVVVMAWGAVLAVTGRQPLWSQRVGRLLAERLRALTGSAASVFATGLAWVAMPCGLLYSALMLASLANGPLQGAFIMVLFAAGSGASLLVAPWLWHRFAIGLGAWRQQWGTRFAGVALLVISVQAVWIDLAHQIDVWCR
jgi:sulfite exporter TauE/SafE